MLDVIYDNNRLFIFDIVENISFNPLNRYWVREDHALLIDYFKSISSQLFRDSTEASHDFKIYFSNYTNISKIHMFLYPITVAEKYYEYTYPEFMKESQKMINYLPKTIRKNKMFIMDKMNARIGSVMKDYDRKSIRVVYHFNDKNFFEISDRKNDTIHIYQIIKPEPNIIRKM